MSKRGSFPKFRPPHRLPQVGDLALGAEDRDPALRSPEDPRRRQVRVLATLAHRQEAGLHRRLVDGLFVEVEQGVDHGDVEMGAPPGALAVEQGVSDSAEGVSDSAEGVGPGVGVGQAHAHERRGPAGSPVMCITPA